LLPKPQNPSQIYLKFYQFNKMTLKALVEILVHVDTCRNIDLFF